MRKEYVELMAQRLKSGDLLWFPRHIYKYIALTISPTVGKPLTGPLMGTIVCTYRCNLRCVQCDLWRRPSEGGNKSREELTTEEMLALIDDFAEIGASSISFTGGEPLLRNDIIELVTHAKNKGLTTHLTSNGLLMDEAAAKSLVLSGLDAINISIDSAAENVHDKLRGVNGAHSRALTAVSNLLRERKKGNERFKIGINTVISKTNIHGLMKLVELTPQIGADYLSLLGVDETVIKYRKEEREGLLGIEEESLNSLNATIDKLIELKRNGSPIDNSIAYLKLLKRFFRGETMPMQCYAGYNSIHVDCYGDVFQCMPWVEKNKPVGNIKEIPLREYWASAQLNDMRKQFKECRACFWNCHVEMNLLHSRHLLSNWI